MAKRKRSKKGRKTAKRRTRRTRKTFSLSDIGAVAECAAGGVCDLGFLGAKRKSGAKSYVRKARKAFKTSRRRRK